MKKYVNGFLIVEGYTDKAFLSTFLECEVVVLEGFAIPRGTLNYIKALSKLYTPILLTDPDEAGKTIASRITKEVSNAIKLTLQFENRKKYKKSGVAESSKDSVLSLLDDYLIDFNPFVTTISQSEFNSLFPLSENQLLTIKNTFHLGDTNKKSMFKRLNYLKITKNEILEVINNGN